MMEDPVEDVPVDGIGATVWSKGLAAVLGRDRLYAGGTFKSISSGHRSSWAHRPCVVTALLLRRFIFFLEVAELGRDLEMDFCFTFP